MRAIASKITGNSYPADIYNSMRDELENAVLSTDQTLDIEAGPDTDLNMLGKAAALYGGASDYYQDSGSANTYVLGRSTNLKSVPAYKDGLLVVFKAAVTNTGASTINISSIGSVDLIDEDLNPLTGGEVLTDYFNYARYSSSLGDFILILTPRSPGVGVLSVGRSQFAYVAATQLSIAGGGYVHNGTKSQVLQINSTITHTITSPGTSQYQYIYLDDSAIVSAGNNIITGTEIINSTTAPTYSVTKKGWYNGLDLCIFAVYIDSVGNVFSFSHSGNYVGFWDRILSFTGAVSDATLTTVTVDIPTFAQKCTVGFNANSVNGDGSFSWQPHESGANRTTLFRWDGATHQSGYLNGCQFDPLTDDAQQFYIYQDTGDTPSCFVYVRGWFFPVQM